MIGIGYREDGSGKGIFYDHFTIQHATQRETCALKVSSSDSKLIHEQLNLHELDHHSFSKRKNLNHRPTTINHSEGIRKLLMDYLEKNEKLTLKQSQSNENKRGHGLPMIKDFSIKLKEIDEDVGLLVIVGHLKLIENDPSVKFRFEFEKNIIRKALLLGQPLMCICSGSWRLWEALGGIVSNINSNSVQHASGMINLDSNGNIKQQHLGHEIVMQGDFEKFSIPECTILKSAMFGHDQNSKKTVDQNHDPIYVNSIHWMAPQFQENASMNNFVDISAISIPDHSIESFETRFGAPVLGIQWHPEAYILNNEQLHQQQVLKYMAQAGDTFVLKRKMLKQLLLNHTLQ